MKLKETILNTFNLKDGEQKTVAILILYSFFIGVALSFFITASTSLFLSDFEKKDLSLSYIISGAVAYIFGNIFTKIQQKFKFTKVLIFTILFLLASITLLLSLYFLFQQAWITFTLFVWVGVFLLLHAVTFWGMAAKLFDLRQGKRVFGLISAGGVVSNIISFFSQPFLLKYIETADMLFFTIGGLLGTIIIMLIIIKRHNTELSVVKTALKIDKQQNTPKEPFYKNKYISLLFILAILPVFGLYFVEYIFYGQAKTIFSEVDSMSQFLAIFFGINAIVEFVIKTFLSGRLISKYGIRFGLIILPIVLLFSVGMSAIAGTFYGEAGLFFGFVALSRLFMRVVRTSFHDTSFQVLFQPVPASERLLFQTKVESIKSGGDILAGTILLLLSSLNLIAFNYIFILIILIWVKIAIDMYSQYKTKLKQLLQQQQKETIIEDGSKNFVMLINQLEKTRGANFELLFNILEHIEPAQINASLIHLFKNSPNENKRYILSKIKQYFVIEAIEVLEAYEFKPEMQNLSTKIRETITFLAINASIPISKLTEFADSEDENIVLKATYLLAYSSRYKAMQIILRLIHSEIIEIRNAAIVSAAKMGRMELISTIIQNLSYKIYADAASSALRLIGEPALPELQLYFVKKSYDQDVISRIIDLFRVIGGQESIPFLRDKINFPVNEIKAKILNALSELQFSASKKEIPHLTQAIEEEISTIVWLMAVIINLKNEPKYAELKNALQNELEQKNERIFNLLSNIYDFQIIKLLRENLRKNDVDSRSYSLEIIDMTFSETMKDMILPLFESENNREIVAKYADMFPQKYETQINSLISIINYDFSKILPWTKACAIKLLEDFDDTRIGSLMASFLVHPVPLLRETATYVLFKKSQAFYQSRIKYLGTEENIAVLTTDVQLQSMKQIPFLLIYDKVLIIRENIYFSKIHENILMPLASTAAEFILLKGKKLKFREKKNRYFFVIISGKISLMINDKEINSFTEGDLIGEITEIATTSKFAKFIAVKDTKLLKISLDQLYNILSTHHEVTNIIINFLKIQTITYSMTAELEVEELV